MEQAQANLELLLLDHANCEKKAAGTALSLIYRHVDKPELLFRLSRLAREELRHFEQVQSLLLRRNIRLRHLPPGRYAGSLRQQLSTQEPARLLDTLLMGAIVEARSAERFAALVPRLDAELAGFYQRLLQAEARHFQDYLSLAEQVPGVSAAARQQRLQALLSYERTLIESPDTLFRFHSGVPA